MALHTYRDRYIQKKPEKTLQQSPVRSRIPTLRNPSPKLQIHFSNLDTIRFPIAFQMKLVLELYTPNP